MFEVRLRPWIMVLITLRITFFFFQALSRSSADTRWYAHCIGKRGCRLVVRICSQHLRLVLLPLPRGKGSLRWEREKAGFVKITPRRVTFAK